MMEILSGLPWPHRVDRLSEVIWHDGNSYQLVAAEMVAKPGEIWSVTPDDTLHYMAQSQHRITVRVNLKKILEVVHPFTFFCIFFSAISSSGGKNCQHLCVQSLRASELHWLAWKKNLETGIFVSFRERKKKKRRHRVYRKPCCAVPTFSCHW